MQIVGYIHAFSWRSSFNLSVGEHQSGFLPWWKSFLTLVEIISYLGGNHFLPWWKSFLTQVENDFHLGKKHILRL